MAKAIARPISRDGDDATSQIFPAQEGMSLRDYFAAQIAAGLISTKEIQDEIMLGDGDESKLAKTAYIFADAMMKERQSQ